MTSAATADDRHAAADALLRQLVARPGHLPLVYHPDYNIGFMGLEKLHPFDSKKYGKIYHGLVQHRAIDDRVCYQPTLPTADVLRVIHPQNYLDSLSSSSTVARMIEVPPVGMLPSSVVRKHVLEPMLLATAGSIVAGLLAARQSVARSGTSASTSTDDGSSGSRSLIWAINLAGGYHHASADNGGGFCIYSDIPLLITHVHRCYPAIQRFLIIDLDAHQGNGHENDKLHRRLPGSITVHIYDQYNGAIYPGDSAARQAIDTEVRLRPHTGDDEYLALVKQHLATIQQSFHPQFVVYNAGTDSLLGDPLGQLDVSDRGIVERDELVFQSCSEHGVPVVMVLSGGYQQHNAAVITQSLMNLHSKFGLFQRDSATPVHASATADSARHANKAEL